MVFFVALKMKYNNSYNNRRIFMPAKKNKRADGEGSIIYREDKKCWMAALSFKDFTSGKNKRKYFYGKSREEVVAKQKEFELELGTGMHIEKNNASVKEYLSLWYNDVCCSSGLKPSTLESYGYIINSGINPILGNIKLQDLSPERVQSFYAEKIHSGLSPKTVRNIHNVLHSALEQALKWKKIKINVTDLVKKPKPSDVDIQYFNQHQVRKFLKYAEKDRLYPFYYTALMTGLRFGELAGLRWDDLNLDDGKLSVRQTIKYTSGEWHIGPPKSKASRRTIAISPSCVSILKSHFDSQTRKKHLRTVFTDTKGGYLRNQNVLNRSLKPLIKKANLPYAGIHGLRHTHVAMLINQKYSLKVIQMRLGHDDAATTLNEYGHLMPDMEQEMLDKLDELISPDNEYVW